MTLEDFKNKKKPKKSSSLDKYKKEILDLYNSNYSQNSIVEFLKTRAIRTTRQNISRYLISILKENKNIKTNFVEKVETTQKVSKEKPKSKNQQQKKSQNISSRKSLFAKSEVDDIDYSFKPPADNLR